MWDRLQEARLAARNEAQKARFKDTLKACLQSQGCEVQETDDPIYWDAHAPQAQGTNGHNVDGVVSVELTAGAILHGDALTDGQFIIVPRGDSALVIGSPGSALSYQGATLRWN